MLHSCFSPREVAFSVGVTHHTSAPSQRCHATCLCSDSPGTHVVTSPHTRRGAAWHAHPGSWVSPILSKPSTGWGDTKTKIGGLSCSYPLLDPRTKWKVCSHTSSRGLHPVIRSSLILSPPLEFQVLVLSFSLMERRAGFRQKWKCRLSYWQTFMLLCPPSASQQL